MGSLERAMARRRLRGVLLALTFVAAAAGYHLLHSPVPASAAGEFRGVRIEAVPHLVQKPDFCGEACAAMYLRKLGKPHDQNDVFNASGLSPLEGRGLRSPELKTALERIGFDVGDVWTKVKAGADACDAPWRALHEDLEVGVPSIVCMRYDSSPATTEHFRLVLGYDSGRDEVLYHEPSEAGGAYRRMARSAFCTLWPLEYERDRWTVIRFRLAPKRIVDPLPREPGVRYTDADYAQHVRRLRKRLPHPGFTVVLEKPFVVVGDEPASYVRRRAEGTVRWAADHLKESYFTADPLHILDVWLFKDAASYEKHAQDLFGAKPHTPYGYYSSHHKALVMNIATGGGTLVHEIVHPFVEANFPKCPPWFNEGLGSLYEQCRELNGTIWGLTNWRLRGLKTAIRAGSLPSFRDLCRMGESVFYGSSRGDNYAQARYLLYYLQENHLLRRYYREFFAARKEDPTGYATLKAVLEEEDMGAFQKRWEAWVLRLTFP
jgi:hypothetical protein